MEKVLSKAVESLITPETSGSARAWSRSICGFALKRILMASRFDNLYEKYLQDGRAQAHYLDRILGVLEVSYHLDERDRAKIPCQGPLVAVANHPFGGIEGLILGSILRTARPDTRIMANHLLKYLNIPELDETFFWVDPFGTFHSVGSNLRPLRRIIQWLKAGNALGVFPAGAVSHFSLKGLAISDPPWNHTIAGIVRKTGATVLPVYFEGRNSLLFHLMGLIHPRLRTVMLPREVLNKKKLAVGVKIGKPIPFEKLSDLTDEEIIEYVRLRTYVLQSRGDELSPGFHPAGRRLGRRRLEPILPPIPSSTVMKEVSALPLEHVLVDTGKFAVYRAMASQIPNVLHEIGRLREITFRQAGEGTGKAIDTDYFDLHYVHLFLWNKERGEIVGAYRLGLTDEIMSHGMEGLYTRTLFEYGAEFLRRIHPAIEVGRSFVRPEYQKDYQPLLLLWRGIGRFIAENPKYRNLFGPVSIDKGYHSISRQLIVAFSRTSSGREDLVDLVRGIHPPRLPRRRAHVLKAASVLHGDINGLSEVIEEIENDQKGIPILLKHYMKLGGELLGMSVDHHFNDVLDVLILVDLTRTAPKILQRYMGAEGMRAFLAHHSVSEAGGPFFAAVNGARECA